MVKVLPVHECSDTSIHIKKLGKVTQIVIIGLVVRDRRNLGVHWTGSLAR